jgi:uncharacterized membrane-anchored protein YjiN (DUF445 family)
MTIQERIQEIREEAERFANMRSDDFGHDVEALSRAESQALQVVCERVKNLADSLDEATYTLSRCLHDYLNSDYTVNGKIINAIQRTFLYIEERVRTLQQKETK